MIGHIASNRPTIRVSTGLLLLFCSACSQNPGNEQLVEGNAIRAEERIADDADDRADHLDEKSAELAREAEAKGAGGQALRNESNADLEAAAAIRAEGQEQSVEARDKIERDAKIVGNGN